MRWRWIDTDQTLLEAEMFYWLEEAMTHSVEASDHWEKINGNIKSD